MCGRYNVIDSPEVKTLMDVLRIQLGNMRYSPDCAPNNELSIIVDRDGGRQIIDSRWHLFQVYNNGWKMHPKYWSINTRYDKLPKRPEYKRSRCLIPASKFVESQEGKNPHLLEFKDRAFVFGGLYKYWVDKETGDSVISNSLITLPGHPKLANIHKQAFPLIMDVEDTETIDKWLDPEFKDVDTFNELLEPVIRWDMIATPINKSSQKVSIGESFVIPAD